MANDITVVDVGMAHVLLGLGSRGGGMPSASGARGIFYALARLEHDIM